MIIKTIRVRLLKGYMWRQTDELNENTNIRKDEPRRSYETCRQRAIPIKAIANKRESNRTEKVDSTSSFNEARFLLKTETTIIAFYLMTPSVSIVIRVT